MTFPPCHVLSVQQVVNNSHQNQGNITYLSGAINIGRKQHAGKRPEDYRFEDDYLQIMRLVLSWRKPVQVMYLL